MTKFGLSVLRLVYIVNGVWCVDFSVVPFLRHKGLRLGQWVLGTGGGQRG